MTFSELIIEVTRYSKRADLLADGIIDSSINEAQRWLADNFPGPDVDDAWLQAVPSDLVNGTDTSYFTTNHASLLRDVACWWIELHWGSAELAEARFVPVKVYFEAINRRQTIERMRTDAQQTAATTPRYRQPEVEG